MVRFSLDREYLEDYEQREKAEIEKFLKRVDEGKFSFERDRYPPNERFMKLQKPAALAAPPVRSIWAQIPFCGSLFLILAPVTQQTFEEFYFSVSEIPKVIDFIKETGRLQVCLAKMPTEYEKLDYLEPFFRGLSPPVNYGLPPPFYSAEGEIQEAENTFHTLAKVRYLDALRWHISEFSFAREMDLKTYMVLKLGHYSIVDDIENLIIDDPLQAFILLGVCQKFIVNPLVNVRHDINNFRLDEITQAKFLPANYQPKQASFPCEIGKFLLKKLTYAPLGSDACKDLMYHYSAYDLQKVQEAMNEGIVTNHPDIVDKSAEELSEILDNIWKDKTLPRRVKGLQVGIPISMAAIGSVAAGPIGAIGGFLAGLGYSVADKFIDLGTERLSEKLAKLKTKSYQANIYDFKKKYKGKMVQE